MVVDKVLFIILSVVFIYLNFLAVNNAFDIEAIHQHEAIVSQNNKKPSEKSHVEYKRAKREDDTAQVSYILNGFLEDGTIPVNFPQDICLFEVDGILHASVLHYSTHPHSNILNQTTFLTIFKNVENGEYVEIFTHETKSAIDMDCISMDDVGYVAIGNNIEVDILDLNEASPVLQVSSTAVAVVQYFSMPFQNKVFLRRHSNDLYFMQLFFNQPKSSNLCPIFKWSSNHFDLIDELPCTNSMYVELFDIEFDIYIALANNKDEFGESTTFSYIYKFNIEHNRFLLHQQIRTHAAVDVKCFQINEEHFLVFANSFEGSVNGNKNLETQSVIYKLSNDYFTPFQTILLYDVIQFLPVLGPQQEFVLLISCKEQGTKSWLYNGWLFYESEVQFTGGALGQGVSNMRTYTLKGSIALVIANTLMLKEASNIYFPQFVLRKIPRVLQQTIESWCDANRIETASNVAAENLAIELGKFPMRNIPDEQIVDEINFLEDVNIGTLTTKALSMEGMVIDQQLADKITELNGIIKDLNKRLEDIELFSTKRNAMADESKQETIFQYDDNILHPEAQVIGQESGFQVHNASQMLELDELTIENTIAMEFINGHSFKDLVFTDGDLNVSEVVVNELILKNHENYIKIVGKSNGNLNGDDMTMSASESFVASTTGVVDNMKVNSLIVDGFVNRLDISMLNEFALKLQGDQILESEINFEILKAASLQAFAEISNRKVSDIARTNNGSLTVDQAIQFANPVFINELIVNQRINNINTKNGGFNILLKRSDHDQFIQTMKIFDEVKLLNPINLQGKITKSNLDKINPIVSFADDIVLEGDYVIKGNATILRTIRGENFYGSGGVHNVKELWIDGLRLDAPVIEQILEFVQPIKVAKLLSRSVNNVDVSKFVRTGEIQTVYGVKNFTGDFHVTNGVCDAFIINDIDLSMLNETVLKRSGAQKVDGKINFNAIRVKRASADTITLFGHKFSDFLMKTDQIISGNVTIQGNLIVNDIQIENIRTNSQICKYYIGAMIGDTITTRESQNSIVTGETFFRNHLTLENVQVGGIVFELGTFDSILGYLNILNEDVKLNGPITFTNNLVVEKLTFTQTINGISSTDFGYQWLLSEINQDFTAPQTVYAIETEENVILNGSFNNIDVVKHFSITQFKDQPITFKNASFARTIFQQPITLNGLLAGIKFPNDIVLKDADFLQSILNVAVDELNVSGKIVVDGKVNYIDYNIACDLLSPNVSPYGMILERDATFEHVPQIENLNGQNVNQLYNEAWLSNRNAEFNGILRFTRVEFLKPIEIKGLLNGMDIGYLGSHYVSLTKTQEIVAEVEISGNVLFESDVRSGSIQIDGAIKDSRRATKLTISSASSGSSIKIEEFDQNVLKNEIDQVITEEWFIAEVHIAGDINSLVNGFDVVTDVVRYNNPSNIVTALKYFESVAVGNINCQDGCTLIDVGVIEWISKVAFLSGNYTIQGTTVMDAPIFYKNLNVLGLVNNVTFNPDNVLLKSVRQNINGNVYISNKSLNYKRILPLSFIDVQLESINRKMLNDFYSNIVHKDDPTATISTRLKFNELLTVNDMKFNGSFNGFNLNQLIDQVRLYQIITNYSDHLQHMSIIGKAIFDELKTKRRYMATYRLQQVIFGNIKKIISVEVATTPTDMFDVFVMLNVTDINGFLNFYIFDPETSVLALDNSLFGFQPKDMHILDIFSVVIGDRDFLVVQTQNHFSGVFGHSFFTHFRGQFRNVYEMHGNISREIVGLHMGTDDCFITYSRHATNIAIACAFFNQPGMLGFQQVSELYSSSGVVQVRSVTSSNRVEIVVLDLEGKISIWSLDQQHRFVRSQVIKTLHTTIYITVVHHKDFHYIAACSQTSPTSTHLGSIEIYISSANAYVNMQSIVIESPTIVELSVVVSTNDLVLYVLTDTIAKPLVVFRHTGINKFKEFTTGVTLARAQRLNVLKAKVLGKELISLISEGLGGMIIEANVK